MDRAEAHPQQTLLPDAERLVRRDLLLLRLEVARRKRRGGAVLASTADGAHQRSARPIRSTR